MASVSGEIEKKYRNTTENLNLGTLQVFSPTSNQSCTQSSGAFSVIRF